MHAIFVLLLFYFTMRATALRLLASLAPVASEGASICCPRAAVPLLHVSAGLHTSCYSSIGRCLPKLTQGACTPNAIYAASGAQPAIAAPAVAALARGRAFSSLPGDIQKDVDRINDMFVEARDVIEDAREVTAPNQLPVTRAHLARALGQRTL